ncbi:MAG: 4-hydroxy-tetrahydrodipicolinate reductase [Acidimicrobiia bacterium]|nr:4-hydroxy-tetrahydrodipicolinate reductase [Acidimicrobiia bacterium]
MKVAVSGARGKMGSIVVQAVQAAPDMEVVARFEAFSDPSIVAAAEVVVEFTRPDVVFKNIEAWRSLEVHAVLGTSGFTEERIGRLRDMWGTGPPNCLVVPNFSIGAVMAMRFSEMAAPFFQGADVIEMHQSAKADAPSGTALATAGKMADAGRFSPPTSEPILDDTLGADLGGVGLHSLRQPVEIADQETRLSSPGEMLSIRHTAFDREAYIPGVLAAIRMIPELPGVTVGLEAVLGL